MGLQVEIEAFEDMEGMLHVIETVGGISFPYIPSLYLKRFEAEARDYCYKPYKYSEIKWSEVESGCFLTIIPPRSCFTELRDAVQKSFDNGLKRLPQYPFSRPLKFNTSALLRYSQTSSGRTPHTDRVVNLQWTIPIYDDSGEGKVGLCADFDGNNPIILDSTPGNLIIMAASGFRGRTTSQFHFVENKGERCAFVGLQY